MTREELEQIYYLHRELRMWEQELERLRSQSLVQSPRGGTGHGSRTSDKVGDRAQKSVDLENRIEEQCEKICRCYDEIVVFIHDNISDSLTRQIVYLRCTCLMSWRKIADKVGGNNSPDGVKKIYYRFFEKLESCPVCPD